MIDNGSDIEIRNEIYLLLYKAMKEGKINDVQRIGYELKILTFNSDQLRIIYTILKGEEV